MTKHTIAISLREARANMEWAHEECPHIDDAEGGPVEPDGHGLRSCCYDYLDARRIYRARLKEWRAAR